MIFQMQDGLDQAVHYCVYFTGQHEGIEAEKQSCQEDDRCRSSEEVKELEFKC